MKEAHKNSPIIVNDNNNIWQDDFRAC